jgi:preprotein translocase subunit SecF
MIDFVGKRNWFYLASLVVLIPGAISLLIPPRLKPGIEFTSGTTFSVKFTVSVDSEALKTALADLGHPEARVQRASDGSFLVRTEALEGVAEAPPVGAAPLGEADRLREELIQRFCERDESGQCKPGTMVTPAGEQDRFYDVSTVSGTVSREIGRNAAIAVAAAAVAILLYISWAFRSVPNPARYGLAAIVALGHDVLLVVGAFSLFGKIFGTEINTMFITGLLTVIGFSVHDSIVVFDRIRETVRVHPRRPFPVSVNTSLMQTVGRSFNTSLTLVFAILALLLITGTEIRPFLLVLLIGTVTGTYSSVFVASMLLVTWHEGDIPRLFRRFFPKREEREALAPGG